MWNSKLNKTRTKAQIMEGVEGEKPHFVSNNTIEYWKDGDRVIRFHLTDIITFKPDESYILNSGGWRTMITKERIGSFSPARVWADKGIWYLNGGVVFYDGIHFDKDGKLLSTSIPDPKKENAKIKRQIAKFVKRLDDEIPVPNGGDCWGCSMVTNEGQHPMGSDCVKSHLDENYLHGSLLVRALQRAGYDNIQSLFQHPPVWLFKNALRRFMVKECI